MRPGVWTLPSSAQQRDVITSTLAGDVNFHDCDAAALCTKRVYVEFYVCAARRIAGFKTQDLESVG